MTRSSDESVSLEDRIKDINQKVRPDLLVSIHANSCASDNACGIETFCLKPSLFHSFRHLSSPSCSTFVKKCREIQYKKGLYLANLLQKITVASAKRINPCVVDRGTKYAVSRILLGIDFPGALVEVGFLTNEREASLLQADRYQLAIAQGLCTGILSYFRNS